MRKLGLTIICAGLFTAGLTPSAGARVGGLYADPYGRLPPESFTEPPAMTNLGAWENMDNALSSSRMGDSYDYAVSKGNADVSCRPSGPRAFCKIDWLSGDVRYRGTGETWYSLKSPVSAFWNYSWNLKMTNYYCLAIKKKPRSKCFKQLVVR